MSTTFNILVALAIAGVSLTRVVAIKGFCLKNTTAKTWQMKNQKTKEVKAGADYAIPSIFLFGER